MENRDDVKILMKITVKNSDKIIILSKLTRTPSPYKFCPHPSTMALFGALCMLEKFRARAYKIILFKMAVSLFFFQPFFLNLYS